MDGSRKLTLALGAVALVSTVTAITLALRPSAPAPALPAAPRTAEAVPDEPRAPGGVNAIAARAIADGGPRAPTVAPGPGGPRRSVTRFRVAFDAGAPVWGCVAAAGAHAMGHLDTGGTLDGLADPTVAAACGGTGPDTLEGFVRVATVPAAPASADGGATACEATLSYTLTRGGQAAPPQELRGERVRAAPPGGCATSLDALEDTLAARIAG